MNRPEEIRGGPTDSQTWFVVGLGDNPERAAYGVSAYLQSLGKRIVPIHPRAEMVHGEQGYATIAEAVAAVGAPDVVDMFVRLTGSGSSPTRPSGRERASSGSSSASSTMTRPSASSTRA